MLLIFSVQPISHYEKNLVIFSSLNGEYNSYARLNGLLFKIKQQYPAHITVVAPLKTLAVISEADAFISISDSWLDTQGQNYPKLSDTDKKDASQFYRIALNFIKSNYPQEKYDVLTVTHYEIRDLAGKIWFPELYSLPDGHYGQSLYRDFKNVADWIKAGGLIYPTKAAHEKVKQRYAALFSPNRKNYVLVSRNYKINQPKVHNTDVVAPDLINHMQAWINTGINIGFPPVHFLSEQDNYHKINDTVSQDELVALFYLADGALLSGSSGGYLCHILSNTDVFMISLDWGNTLNPPISVSEARKTNTLIRTEHIYMHHEAGDYMGKYAETTNMLLTHEKQNKLIFSDEKPIVLIPT